MFSHDAPVDGVLQLDAVEKDLVHEHMCVDTRDHEDHTFCGVMFDVACATELPAEYIEIESVSVRGDLGPMTVWHTEIGVGGSYMRKEQTEELWTKVYEGTHNRSRQTYAELRLLEPLRHQVVYDGSSSGLSRISTASATIGSGSSERMSRDDYGSPRRGTGVRKYWHAGPF